MAIAWFTFHPWLMSTIRSTPSPTDSRSTRNRAISFAGLSSAPMRNFMARKPCCTSCGAVSARASRSYVRQRCPLAYVGARSRNPPNSLYTGCPNALPLMSHSRHVDGGDGARDQPRRCSAAGHGEQPAGDGFHRQGVAAYGLLRQGVHRSFEGVPHDRAAESGVADPLDALVGAQLQRDEVGNHRLRRAAGGAPLPGRAHKPRLELTNLHPGPPVHPPKNPPLARPRPHSKPTARGFPQPKQPTPRTTAPTKPSR